MGKVKEAQEVFISKHAKNTENFQKSLKQFNLDAGWQLLNIGKPDKVLNFFKQSEVDPRLLIMLFKELQEDLRPTLNDHVTNIGRHIFLSSQYTSNQTRDTDFDVQREEMKAKTAVKQLLHHLNLKYLSELRKDEDKVADFMQSTWTLNPECIKPQEQWKLRDIVPLVQTALIRLYIEDGPEGKANIHEFFN